MRHILFVDPIEKLNIKKDSSLMIGLSLKELGHEVYLLFEKDFCVYTDGNMELEVYPYTGNYKEDGFYLEKIDINEEKQRLGQHLIYFIEQLEGDGYRTVFKNFWVWYAAALFIFLATEIPIMSLLNHLLQTKANVASAIPIMKLNIIISSFY